MTAADAFRDFLRHPPWLEIAANTVNLLSILLATRNSSHTWWTGLVGCALFGWLFFTAQLYADATLQIFFIITGVLGWWQWLHQGTQRIERPITLTSPRQLTWMIPAAIATATAYGWLLHRFTQAFAPFTDSALLTLSVTAQFLLMQRKRETWIFWFLANTLAVPLYLSRELWLTAFFYVLFWFNAPLGFLRWHREYATTQTRPFA
ncbi:MAG: nicotinamide riboside transporter PnuC [Nibricoccus sp.]